MSRTALVTILLLAGLLLVAAAAVPQAPYRATYGCPDPPARVTSNGACLYR